MSTYSVEEIDAAIAELPSQSAEILRQSLRRHHGAFGPTAPLKAYRLPDGETSAKAASIMRGVVDGSSTTDIGDHYAGQPFLKSIFDARRGDPTANEYVKAVLGTSAATGGAIVPNNFVAGIASWASSENVYRRIMNFVTVTGTAAIDVPYDRDEVEAAILQGAYGSNKDVRDFGFGEATATLYQIAQIADVGNQLLRQSNGAAEAHVRRRLGGAFAKAEARYISSGTGSSQPKGILQSFTSTYIGAFLTALSSEPKIAAIGRAIGALESRGHAATAIVMGPTDYWEIVTETLGSNDEGGFAVLPGGTTAETQQAIYGVPVYRDLHWPASAAGTAIVGDFAPVEAYVDGDLTIDVSSEAGSRFDQNITGFRAEEMFGFTADPWYLTGHFQKVTGL